VNEMTHMEKLGMIERYTRSIQIIAATVLSVLIFADGVIEWLIGNTLFFSGVPMNFKVAVGFIAIVLAGSDNPLGK